MGETPIEDEVNNLTLEEKIEDDIDNITIIGPIMSTPNLGLILIIEICILNMNSFMY